MTPDELMLKAERAEESARLLLQDHDADGACNRAYYAMFSAARAALAAVVPDFAETVRTHSGLIAAFSQHFVKTGRVSVELGRALNRAEEIRLMADYQGGSAAPEQIAWIVDVAGQFVSAIKSLIEGLHR